MPSITTENYLKAIYVLSERSPDRPLVRLGELAEELDLTPGTITTMIRSLAKRDLVTYKPRSGVRLTENGRGQALQVLRRHRLIELFLVQVMGMDWSEVHEDAEALEHAVSDRFISRMDEMMGYPTEDPHGDPIPNAVSTMPDQEGRALTEVNPGDYILTRVHDQDPDFLDWLSSNRLMPGTPVTLCGKDIQAGLLTLRLADRAEELPLGLEAARHLKVNPRVST